MSISIFKSAVFENSKSTKKSKVTANIIEDKNIVIKSFAMGFIPEIPDFALDKHTIRGAKMGRDSFHFLNEASKVIPQLPIDNDYKQRYEEILKTYNPDNVCKSAFKYNPWQE